MTIPSRPIGTSGQQIAVKENDAWIFLDRPSPGEVSDIFMLDGKRYRATWRNASTGELYLRECPKAVEG